LLSELTIQPQPATTEQPTTITARSNHSENQPTRATNARTSVNERGFQNGDNVTIVIDKRGAWRTKTKWEGRQGKVIKATKCFVWVKVDYEDNVVLQKENFKVEPVL
jgi:ribosomal protein L21E